jgi:pyruvate,water dikinase
VKAVLVIPLASLRGDETRPVGAKAAVLSRLLRAGLPVPLGFCIAARAYREHLREAVSLERIRRALGGIDPRGAATTGPGMGASGSSPAALLAEIRGALRSAPIAGRLRDDIALRWKELGAPSVAVRSSATAEDLPGRSFAGQHDTYLGVRDIEDCLEKVKATWASLWTERAFDYRRRQGIDHLSVDMAVIVQTMVPAEAAGVMFTADPVTGRRDCVVVEASYGLGEAVVSGKVVPDRVVVSKRVAAVEARSTAYKAIEVVPSEEGGVRVEEVGEGRAGHPCLDDATACRLALLGASVEALLGGPQDVEWALSRPGEGKLHLLQSRPITALPPEPRRPMEERQVWTNANLREVAPDVVTPMTWSGIERLADPFIQPVFRRLGVEAKPTDMAALVAGRIYFNVNAVAALGKAVFGKSEIDGSALFGQRGQGSDAPARVRLPEADLPPLRVRRLRAVVSLPSLLWWFLRNPLRRGRGLLERFTVRLEEEERRSWRSLDDGDLVRTIVGADRIPREELLRDGQVPLIAAAGLACYVILAALSRRWFGAEGGELAHRLLVGLGGMEDAEAGIAVWELAAAAHEEPLVASAIREERSFAEVRRRLAGCAGSAGYFAAWEAFMGRHGHHTRGEFELANPRWAERPDHILGLVRSHLEGVGRIDPVAEARRLSAERERLEGECLSRLRNPLRRRLFAAVLSRAQEGLRFRETVKSRVVRYMALARRMLLELGERLARRGTLDRAEDVFFLRFEELEPATAGAFDPRDVVLARRAEHERNAALDPPAIVFGRFEPERCPPEVVDAKASLLRGIGVSAGVARGAARVILHAGEEHVRPGEVLVAPFTDPGWTPYFVNAAAIVMDQGGLLSHGSIVAREYGIPCVVNVGPATRILRTGQFVEVDGGRGEVRIAR